MEYSLEKLVTSMWEHRKTKDFERKSLESSYRGLKVKASIGMTGNISKIPWISYCAKGQETRKGIYPVLLFYGTQEFLQENLNHVNVRKIVLAYGVSATQKPDVLWGAEVEGKKTIKEAFAEWKYETADTIIKKYNSSYIYKVYNWDDSVNYELIQKDIDAIIDTYLQILEKISLPVKSREPLPLKKRTLNFNILQPKYYPYLTALRTKPFMLLAGISGTGKSRIVRKLAQATTTQAYENDEDRWKDNRPENFELIQVKPNWHNSMDVVGFYSNISNKYEFTPFVEFIVKAWQHTGTPYFLCLDEMNLAPVEEYFAEFLSAIESRSTDKDGNYVTDPIIKPFKEFGKEACEEMLKHFFGEALYTESNPLAKQFAEKGLTLPPNLMVMGTVNMDETTFSFSRKVLDRAMSVEMNEVDYDSFLSGESDLFPVLTELNELLVNRPQQTSEVKEQIDSEKVIAYLKAVNELMEGTPFKLGYRAANEALLYVSASKDFAGEEFELERSLDEFTLMKILSRLEGDDNRLAIDEDDPRIAPIGVDAIIDNGEDHINLLNSLRAIVRKHIGADTSTEKKINAMYRTLEREHFVSYWA